MPNQNADPKSEPKHDTPADWTVRRIMSELNPKELWGLLGAFATVIGLSASGGVFVGKNMIVTPPCSSSPAPPVTADPWSSWTREADRIPECGTDACQVDLVKELINKLPAQETSVARGDLALSERDAKAGRLLLERSSRILWTHFGISKDRFLGTGVSLPDKAATISGGLVEFWTPQMPETRVGVWAWKANPALLSENHTVRTFLSNAKDGPNPSSDEEALRFELCRKDLARGNDANGKQTTCAFQQRLNDTLKPALFRCNQFPDSKYEGTVGAPGARRVFFTRLRDVLDLTIGEACARTGRRADTSEKTTTLFLWVALPEVADDALPATWSTLFTHFAEWEK